MPDYQKGKIYSIRSHLTDDVYIGSTCKRLSMRMGHHRYNAKNGIGSCSSKTILDFGDAYIELIEEYPCDNREQLNRREGEIIRNTVCINKEIAGRTDKQYREDNKEKIEEYAKQYREDNKDKLAEQKKQYYELNKERLAEYNKQYYQLKKGNLPA